MIAGYEYRLNGGAWVDNGLSRSLELTGLDEATTYSFEVRSYDTSSPVKYGVPRAYRFTTASSLNFLLGNGEHLLGNGEQLYI
jgi:hypothetical protein